MKIAKELSGTANSDNHTFHFAGSFLVHCVVLLSDQYAAICHTYDDNTNTTQLFS